VLKHIIGFFLFISSLNLYGIDNHSVDQVRHIALPDTVALTFDDGPNPIFTPQILAILKKNNIKATFFVVGVNAEKYPELIKQIYAEGHVIGSHSQTHPMLTKIADKNLQTEITEPSEIIFKIIGIKPKCLRYPYGASNTHVRSEIRAQGLIPLPMGFNSFDYDRPGAQKIIDWVLKNSYSKQVILMHDGFTKREQTVAALPVIIDGIKKKGLGFSTICG
jgi:peptidoglycan-N-acetylglucosamine deacetylase